MFEPISQDDLKKAAEDAQRQLVERKRQELAAHQRQNRILTAVDFTLRLPFLVGAAAVDLAQRIPPRLYQDLMRLPEGFRRLTLSPNHTEDRLGGHALVYDEDAKGLRSEMLLSTKHAFGVTAVFILQESVPGTVASLRTQYEEALKASVERLEKQPPPFGAYMAASEDDVHDAERWPTFLPAHSHVGLYRKDRTIFLILKTGAGHTIGEEIDKILAEDRMTVGRFACDPRVKRVKEMVVRNAQRLAVRISRDLGFTVRTREDIFTRLVDDLSYYDLATPLMIVKHNHIMAHATSKTVHVYVDVACHSAVVYDKDEYVVWCGKTRDYTLAVRKNDNDAAVLPLKTDKIRTADRVEASEEEQESISHHVHYVHPRSETTGRFIKYHLHSAEEKHRYKHVASVHV